MSAHTPGPWEFDGDYIWSSPIGVYVADPKTEDMLSGLRMSIHEGQKQIEANARLIAAAPELLEALELACRVLSDLQGMTRDGSRVRAAWDNGIAAIKKARGEA